jgi:hypothetical protein
VDGNGVGEAAHADHVLVLGAQQRADLGQQVAPAGLHRGRAAAEQQLVGQQADDEALRGDDRRHLAGEAVLVDVAVDARLEQLEVLLLDLGRRGGGGLRVDLAALAGAVAGDGRRRGRRRGRDLRSGGRAAALLQGAPAGQDAPGEGVLQGALKRDELGDVHRRDREQDHEQRHQQRDHVRVGEQPALVALLGLLDGAHAPAT